MNTRPNPRGDRHPHSRRRQDNTRSSHDKNRAVHERPFRERAKPKPKSRPRKSKTVPAQNPPIAPKLPDASGRVRINRYLSMCGIASRRKAEELVAEGRVTVNGVKISALSTTLLPGRDRVFV